MKKVIVIGGGPGGYVAAIRAAQLGAEVHLIEKQFIGGTCLNVGCIPTKAVLHAAELYQDILRGTAWGIEAEQVSVNWKGVMTKKQATVSRLVKGVEGLLRANGVTVHKGMATVQDSRRVAINDLALEADVLIIAVGSVPVMPSFPGSDLPGIIDSTAALSLSAIPNRLVIVGGGVIGVEFAALYRAFGAEVTVIEMMPEILPTVDREIAALVRKDLSQKGVKFLTSAKLTQVSQSGEQLVAEVTTGSSSQALTAEQLLVAVGRRPAIGGMGLEEAGIHLQQGKLAVNEHFQTNIPHVYAIGDCNGILMLAHAASAQGIAAVEHALGHPPAYFPQTIPACIYTKPEVASVGLSEEQAKERQLTYKVGKFPLAGNGKSVIESTGTGLVKILSGAKHGEIVGVHIFGPRATDLIGEAALAIRLEATVDELISTIHAHPTVSEALAEAALATSDSAIHWPPGKR